jgi:uncharacterized Tic20 family protein
MIEKGYMPPLSEARTLGQTAMFQGGKAALAIDGDWTIGTYTATKGVRVGFSPQPRGPEGSWSMYNGLADAIWVGTKHKAEAWKWVKFLASRECQNIVGTAAVVFPAMQEGTDRAVATHKKKGVDVSAFTSYLKDEHTLLYPITTKAPQINLLVQPTLEKVLLGRHRSRGAAEGQRPGQQPAGVRVSSSITPTRAAAASHLAAVAAVLAATFAAGGPQIWTGMAAFLGPMLALLTVGRAGGFARRHAVAALRFNVSVAIYLGAIVLGLRLTAGSPYTIQFVPFLLFLNLLVAFNWLMFTAIAVHRAATGQTFSYPMTLRRLRSPSTPTLRGSL